MSVVPKPEAYLSVSNIEVIYDHVILVLKGVSLGVPTGGIVALLGANGAGKTTTLKAISNLLQSERGEVTKGSIVFDGEEVQARSPNELVRRGFETLKITAERFKEIGLENFAAPITNVSCEDHNGHHAAYMQQWDGTKWVKITDWITPMKDKVRPMLEAAAKDYVSKDTAWPKRSEPCDKSS